MSDLSTMDDAALRAVAANYGIAGAETMDRETLEASVREAGEAQKSNFVTPREVQ